MTEKDLFREVGKIKEEYVVEAEEYKRSVIHNVVFRRSLITAACLVVCVGLYWGVQQTAKQFDSAENMQAEQIYADTDVVQPETATENYAAEAVEKETAYRTEENVSVKEEVECIPQSTTAEIQQSSNTNVQDGLQDVVVEAEKLKTPQDLLKAEKRLEIVMGKIEYGREYWDAFREKVEISEPAELIIVKYTVEGDPIITCVQFDGITFNVTEDNSLDAFAGSEAGIKTSTYNYLNLIGAEQEMEVILSKEKGLAKEQLHSGEYETFSLVQYNIEE